MAQTSVTNYVKGGLVPVRKLGGGYYSGGFSQYSIKNGEAQNIFRGDPVHLSAGFVRVLPSVGAPILGVFMGCSYVDQNSNQPVEKNYFPANTSMDGGQFIDGYNNPRAKVVDDPDMVYWAKSTKTSASAGIVGGYGSHLNGVGNGNTLFGQSNASVSVGNVDLTRAQLRVIGKAELPGNEYNETDTVLEVVLVQHEHRRGSGLVPATVA